MNASACKYAVLGFAIVSLASSVGARLGDGPRVDEMLAQSALVCAGKVTSYESVSLSADDSTTWLAAKLDVDRWVKGHLATNSVMIVMGRIDAPERTREILAQLRSQSRPVRVLVFLSAANTNMTRFKLIDEMNAMIQVGNSAPVGVANATADELIRGELEAGLRESLPSQQAQIRTVLDRWIEAKAAAGTKSD